MWTRPLQAALLASITIAAGCSSSQSNTEPPVTSVNVATYKAQLAVGVATFVNGTTGLNVVATFRQPSGLTATLVNTPTITGPSGFVVPAVAAAGVDGGTDHISGSPQVPPLSTPEATTLGESGGVFAYGIAPDNTDISGSAYNFIFDGAFYDATDTLTGSYLSGSPAAATPVEFRGGPPSYPNVLDGTYEAGFEGFTQGFVTFDTAPVAGTYALSILVPSSNVPNRTIIASPGTLTSTTGSLGPIAAAPVFAEDGAGGGTATCTVPATAKETLVDILDITGGEFYSSVVQGGGAISATFADTIGADNGPAFAAGDSYTVSCIAVNYPAFESGVPNNHQELPTLVGANGQADISFSPNDFVMYYGGAPAPSSNARRNPATLLHRSTTSSRG